MSGRFIESAPTVSSWILTSVISNALTLVNTTLPTASIPSPMLANRLLSGMTLIDWAEKSAGLILRAPQNQVSGDTPLYSR